MGFNWTIKNILIMKKILLSILFSLGIINVAFGAVAYDNSTSATTGFGATSITQSLTVGSGANRYLVVTAGSVQANSTLTATYNGVSMIQLATWTNDSDNCSGNPMNQYLFGLANPTSGANNIVLSGGSGSGRLWLNASAYTGVDTVVDASSTLSNQTSGISPAVLNLTTITDNSWVVGMFYTGGNPPTLSSSASTIRSQIVVGTGANCGAGAIFDSNAPVTPAGTFGSSIGFSGKTGHYAMGSVALRPLQAGGGSFVKGMMGFFRFFRHK